MSYSQKHIVQDCIKCKKKSFLNFKYTLIHIFLYILPRIIAHSTNPNRVMCTAETREVASPSYVDLDTINHLYD